jgi:hypothetical protein
VGLTACKQNVTTRAKLLRGLFIFGERKGFNAEEEERRRGGHREEPTESQRGSGKTRRLRLPVMTTAREWPSGEMAKSRKLMP